MSPLVISGALVIGLALGLTGAGGSILTVPVLIHFAGVAPADAVAMSLFIVGSTAAVGAVQRAASGDLHFPAAAWFSLSGLAGAIVGARITHLLPPWALVFLFAVIMGFVGIRMGFGKSEAAVAEPNCNPLRCFVAGGGVGVLTGFLGVGGGFLLLPALTKFARLPVRIAMGTSLAIIAINALGGFLGHLHSASIDWTLTMAFTVVASVCVLLGGRLTTRINPRRSRRVFAGVVLATAVGMIASII